MLSVCELDDLYDKMLERMGGDLLPAITKANRTGDLGGLLASLEMSDLMEDEQEESCHATRILVMGDSMVKESRLRSIARKHRLDDDRFEFELEYEGLQHFNFAKLRSTWTYRAVLVGPMPHSTPGTFDAGSAVSEMESHPEMYPQVIEMRDSTGLKITNNSFAKALDELAS
jgi:hypothetical protein